MAEKRPKPKPKHPTPEQLDERLVIPLDTKTTIESILKVDPESEPAEKPGENEG